MLEGLKRWFQRRPATATPAVDDALQAWADARHFTLRAATGDGLVIDGRLGATPWRMEWGPSQRPYITGPELRLRAEMGLSSELQLVLLNRQLQEKMEKAVFDQYVEGVQTRIDNQTPPEMRWLVMFPKLSGSEIGPLKDGYAALGSIKPWLQQWLDGPLTAALQAQHLPPEQPLVLMIGRGRLMLRTALPEPDLQPLQAWLRLFETAMREARRVANDNPDSLSPSTQPSMWSASALPGDEHHKG